MTQALLAQGANAIYQAGAVVVDATITVANWLGRSVCYLKDVVAGYAAKAIEVACCCFCAMKHLVIQNPQVLTVFGISLGIGIAGLLFAKFLSNPTPASATV
ncbi:MAG: hypothetical protein KGZ39_05215 [Simkania sp.]|nr:hypothetical protein [Simkania sp.]